MSRGKRYSKEFKMNIVNIYNNEHRSRNSLAVEYGVTASTVDKWVKQFSPVELSDGTTTTGKEMNALKKENERLKEELEILKAAAVLLAKK